MSRTDWDAYSAFYEEAAEPYEADFTALKWGMSPGLRVLEVGVGTGRVAMELVSESKKYVGIDVSSGMLDILRKKKTEGITIVHGDFMHFMTDEEFDRILMPYRVLHYLRPWESALEKAYGLLAPGGMLFLDIKTDAKEEEWIYHGPHRLLRIRQLLNRQDVRVKACSLGFGIAHTMATEPCVITMWLEKHHED